MLDTVALISAWIGSKVYFDSRKGPSIQLFEKPQEQSRANVGVNLSFQDKLLFVNSGSQRGALVSVGVRYAKSAKGHISITVSNQSSSEAAGIEIKGENKWLTLIENAANGSRTRAQSRKSSYPRVST